MTITDAASTEATERLKAAIDPPVAPLPAVIERTEPTPPRDTVGREQTELVKRTICKGATDDELELFIAVCNRTRLDPFARQIFAIQRYDSKERKNVMGIQTSIDGLRLIADRHGDYAGQEKAEWCGDDGEWHDVWLSDEHPKAARVAVLRRSFLQPCFGIAHWSEYAQTYMKDGAEQLGPMWKKMPRLMLAKVAEALALRKAFPADMSGVYTVEEMSQSVVDTAPVPDGFVTADQSIAAHAVMAERIRSLPDDVDREPFQTFRAERGWPMSAADLDEMSQMVDEALADQSPWEDPDGQGPPSTPQPPDAPPSAPQSDSAPPQAPTVPAAPPAPSAPAEALPLMPDAIVAEVAAQIKALTPRQLVAELRKRNLPDAKDETANRLGLEAVLLNELAAAQKAADDPYTSSPYPDEMERLIVDLPDAEKAKLLTWLEAQGFTPAVVAASAPALKRAVAHVTKMAEKATAGT